MFLQFPPSLSAPRRLLLTAAAKRLEEDHRQGFLGLVLSGSAAHGLETERSDLDVLVVLEPDVANGPDAPALHTPELELLPITLEHLERVARFGDGEWPYRWSYAWAPVLLDYTGGRIPAAIDRQTYLTPEETLEIVLHHRIGDYVNLSYRALKSARDGRTLEASLDASEAIPIFLDVVFALDGLVRPYNKALVWALHNHPLRDWTAAELLRLIELAGQGDPAAMKQGIAGVHLAAMRFDAVHQQHAFRDFFDHWSGDAYASVLGLPGRC